MNRGFTIVELLIVIVVIGILASLVTFAVTGSQASARRAQTYSLVKSYRTALLSRASVTGSYSLSPSSVCLGTGYPDIDGNGTAGDCTAGSSGADVWGRESTSFNTELQPYISPQPVPGSRVISSSWGLRAATGAVYEVISETTYNGAPHHWWLVYTLEGATTKCPVGPVASIVSYPDLSSTAPSNGYTESWSDGVRCWIALPDPSKQ